MIDIVKQKVIGKRMKRMEEENGGRTIQFKTENGSKKEN